VHTNKKILVAPLNWGLGHATRCIPIIEALENHGFEPVIASDGAALALLKKEFPHLNTIELPPYHIEYAKNGAFFKWRLLLQMPKMFITVSRESKMVCKLIKQHNISGIISDNRLGVYCKSVPSVFITHQLNVLNGNTTQLATAIHQSYIKKYDECWVPDIEGSANLSGKLGRTDNTTLKLKYIGPISRLHKTVMPKKYDLMVLLSGPEPQRTMLEQKLETQLKYHDKKVLFIRGIIEDTEQMIRQGNITFYNYMGSASLEQAFNESEVVLCRSGYTNVMDLAKLGKKAFFIPTPGQYEQEYLAKKLKRCGLVPYASQNNFKLKDLAKADVYKGLKNVNGGAKWKDLFSLFEGK